MRVIGMGAGNIQIDPRLRRSRGVYGAGTSNMCRFRWSSSSVLTMISSYGIPQSSSRYRLDLSYTPTISIERVILCRLCVASERRLARSSSTFQSLHPTRRNSEASHAPIWGCMDGRIVCSHKVKEALACFSKGWAAISMMRQIITRLKYLARSSCGRQPRLSQGTTRRGSLGLRHWEASVRLIEVGSSRAV